MPGLLISAFALSLATAAPTAPKAPSATGPGDILAAMGMQVVAPPTAEQIAAARAEADRIAAAGGAADLFENVTTTASPALRHRASGVVCTFTSGSPINKVMVFQQPRGDSIGCNTSRGARSYSLFMDRPPHPPPLEQVAGPIAASIRKRFPDAASPPTVMTASGKDVDGQALPPHRAIVFVRASPTGPMVEREALGYAGPWLIQQRITEPEANSMAADLLNEFEFQAYQKAVLKTLRDGSSAPPPGPPPGQSTVNSPTS